SMLWRRAETPAMGSSHVSTEHVQTAVEVDDRARDCLRTGRAEERAGEGDLAQFCLPTNRNLSAQRLDLRLVREGRVRGQITLRLGDAWVDVVYGDAELAQPFGKRLGEHADAALGGGMRYTGPAAMVAVRAVHVQDAPVAGVAHGRSEGLGEVPGAGQLLVEVMVPFLVGGLPEVLVQPPRGIGDVDVDPAEGILGACLELLYHLLFAGIAQHDDAP